MILDPLPPVVRFCGMRHLFGLGLLAWLFSLSIQPLAAQISRSVAPIVCYASDEVAAHQIPHSWLAFKTDSQRSTFDIAYTNQVPTPARDALEFAASIWGSILSSPIPFSLEVTWDTLSTSVLASAGPTQIYRNSIFNQFPTSYWYPVSLAEAIDGSNLNGNSADMTIRINSAISWYYGGAQQPGAGQYDFVMVMVHELAHCLGFFSSASNRNDTAELGLDGELLIFESFLLENDLMSLTNDSTYPNPSPELLQALTSDSLFFDCPDAEAISGEGLKLHAPSQFRRGSSVAHLDEATYPIGTPHVLMTPNIAMQEASYDPGELTLCIMEQMGWDVTPLSSVPLSQESSPWAGRLRLYPNPATQALRLEGITDQRPLRYAIHDQQGRVLQQGAWQTDQALSVRSLAAGWYLMELISARGERQWQAFSKR